MALFDTVTKEHVLEAINALLSGAQNDFPESRYYDVLFNNQRFPPKPIMALALKFATGRQIQTTDFNGGENTESFKRLKELGFEIVSKKGKVSYWIEKTLVEGRPDRTKGDRSLGKALWSPQRSKDDKDIYRNMREVQKGDIILHLVNNDAFVGISKVKASFVETKGIEGTNWNGPSYLIELEDFKQFDTPIDRKTLLNRNNKSILEEIRKDSEVFYTYDLKLRQGAYLTPCPEKLYDLIMRPRVDLNLKVLEFDHKAFLNHLKDSGLLFNQRVVVRFLSSLLTKPFVILTGLSGSGKTKLAQSFIQWICKDKSQNRIVPVGADWTNREPLLGFPNALSKNEYIEPDSGVLRLIRDAEANPKLPYFLLLDEMNLSHVERYFADFLSVMESGESIHLHSMDDCLVSKQIFLPKNLFIIGTVNIDETTYMFSPKVLDRANTIEFRINEEELGSFLQDNKALDMDSLKGKGAEMAVGFVELSESKDHLIEENVNMTLLSFFRELKNAGAEFGYRTANEIQVLLSQLGKLDKDFGINERLDIAIMQKLLPKVHGSRRKLEKTLKALTKLCLKSNVEETEVMSYLNGENPIQSGDENVLFPISLEKIQRMYQGAIDHGFASYAEA